MGERTMYYTMFARSFSKHEQKKLGYGAFLGCLVTALTFYSVFRPYLSPLSLLNLQLALDGGLKLLRITDTNTVQDFRGPNVTSNKLEPMCHFEARSDFCEFTGDVRISGASSTIFFVSSQPGLSAEIRPYARKTDKTAMSFVRKWAVKSAAGGDSMPQCTRNHSIPAVLFSSGAYAGNNFHDFSDIIIPLYMTSRQFLGEVMFLVTDRKSWWVNKFNTLLLKLSNHELVDIDKEEGVHCFRRVLIGLKRDPRELKIDPSSSGHTMRSFREFLRSAYSLKKASAIKIKDGGSGTRPRLLIISRNRTRSFVNVGEIAGMGRRLGFEVVVAEARMNSVSRFAEMVNSCDVMVGVHGAGLTNMVYLPENAVLIQVVPVGGMEWLARTYFGEPSKDMNIRYLEYGIGAEESSLSMQFPIDHEVFRRPFDISKKGWKAFKELYLDRQDVKLDVNRFRPTLLKALELLR